MSEVTAGTESGHLYKFSYGHTLHAWASFPTRNVPETPLPKKTILVVGVPIGGTSAVAAVLDALGVMMGDPNHLKAGGAFEDQVFMALSNPDCREVIKLRNEEHNIWGFKNPKGVSVLNSVGWFRNPYCIFVFRDPIAASYHYSQSHKLTVDAGIAQFHDETELLYRAMMKTTQPSLIASYERVKSTPEFFIQAIARFIELTPTPEQWVDALGRVSSRGGYLGMPQEFGPGPGNQPPE